MPVVSYMYIKRVADGSSLFNWGNSLIRSAVIGLRVRDSVRRTIYK